MLLSRSVPLVAALRVPAASALKSAPRAAAARAGARNGSYVPPNSPPVPPSERASGLRWHSSMTRGVLQQGALKLHPYSMLTDARVRFASSTGAGGPPTSAAPGGASSSTGARGGSSSSGGGGGGGSGTRSPNVEERNKVLALYAFATVIAVVGLSYAAVPLYKVFCQVTGYGGTTQMATEEKFKTMKPVEGARQVTVLFNADTSANMPWVFKPQQRSVKVVPGETALAFYTAYNPTDKPITGVSTYNISPMRAGLYFSKIQCFCFEEQRLRPHEEIDMPVFFYVDPAFLDDPAMDGIKTLTLSYTFFRTGEQEVLDIEHEIRQKSAGGAQELGQSASGPMSGPTAARVKAWTEEVAKTTGLAGKLEAQQQAKTTGGGGRAGGGPNTTTTTTSTAGA